MAGITTLTLEDVAAQPLTLDITLPDERQVSIRVMPLSYAKYNEIGWLVPEPETVMKMDVIGGKKQKVADEDATRKARNQANQQRVLMRVAWALVEAGNFTALKNKPLAEQAAALETIDSGLLNTIAIFIQNRASADMRRIALLKDSFRREPDADIGDADMQSDGLDDPTVDGADG